MSESIHGQSPTEETSIQTVGQAKEAAERIRSEHPKFREMVNNQDFILFSLGKIISRWVSYSGFLEEIQTESDICPLLKTEEEIAHFTSIKEYYEKEIDFYARLAAGESFDSLVSEDERNYNDFCGNAYVTGLEWVWSREGEKPTDSRMDRVRRRWFGGGKTIQDGISYAYEKDTHKACYDRFNPDPSNDSWGMVSDKNIQRAQTEMEIAFQKAKEVEEKYHLQQQQENE